MFQGSRGSKGHHEASAPIATAQFFNHCGRLGSLEYLRQPRNQAPKYGALMRWIEQDPGDGRPPSAPANLASAVGATSVSVTWTPSTGATSNEVAVVVQ